MFEFNDALAKIGLDPQKVIVLRHKPEPELRQVFPWLALERPDLYNAFQQTQGRILEGALLKAEYLASFIWHKPGKALFVGMYGLGGHKKLTYRQYWQVKEYKELKSLGMRGFSGDRDSILWFDMKPLDTLKDWKGRLVIDWPGLERSWWRWADRNRFLISSIEQSQQLVTKVPAWDEINLSYEELLAIPGSWEDAMRQWRGIYYIFDRKHNDGYVGSAYGRDNILGRWKNYAKRGHGGNKELRNREPRDFRFSILQLVAQDLESHEVINLESKWKMRLHTRDYGMNSN